MRIREVLLKALNNHLTVQSTAANRQHQHAKQWGTAKGHNNSRQSTRAEIWQTKIKRSLSNME